MADNTNKNDAFEKFFKKKAEEYDIDYSEQDWLKLERKLDLKDAQISYQRKVRWIAAASLLIIGLLGYFTYDNYNKINQLDQLINEGITSSEDPNRIPESPDESGNTIPEAAREPEEDLAQNPAPGRDEQEDTSPASPDTNLEPVRVSEPIENPDNALAFTEDHETNPVSFQATGGNEFPETIAVSDVPASPGDYHAMVSVPQQPAMVSASPDVVGFSQPVLSRFTIRLLVSPDLSATGSVANVQEPGYKIGLGLNYQLTPKLSLATGVIHSDVRYTANSSDYSPSSNSYEDNNSAMIPSRVLAKCLILDIPVHLNYEFMQFGRSRIFASAGLSSYIMMDEKYDFKYDDYYPGQADSWSGQTGILHLFSNAGFSVGYQMDLNQRWGLQIEPFVKIPLKEVGWGNVKLYSLGSFVSLDYRF